MPNTPRSSTSSDASHKLKLCLNKLHLSLPRRTSSTTSTASTALTNTNNTSSPPPPPPTHHKGDDSILSHRTKLKLTGDAKPGSHSAYWGLTPDGQKHEPTYVDASEISRMLDFEDGIRETKTKKEKNKRKEGKQEE